MSWTDKTFGEMVRALREDAGITMGDLAKALSVSVTYISDIERGQRRPPSVQMVDAIAKRLGVDPLGLHRLACEDKGIFVIPADGLPNYARWFLAQVAGGERYTEAFWDKVVRLAQENKL
jgi:transcriptional regulator with XRE-family HTH domain